jgi:hypothetical protein
VDPSGFGVGAAVEVNVAQDRAQIKCFVRAHPRGTLPPSVVNSDLVLDWVMRTRALRRAVTRGSMQLAGWIHALAS